MCLFQNELKTFFTRKDSACAEHGRESQGITSCIALQGMVKNPRVIKKKEFARFCVRDKGTCKFEE